MFWIVCCSCSNYTREYRNSVRTTVREISEILQIDGRSGGSCLLAIQQYGVRSEKTRLEGVVPLERSSQETFEIPFSPDAIE